MNNFGKKLRQWRGQRTQVQACKLLGVCRKTYQVWEDGSCNPWPLTIAQVQRIMAENADFGVNVKQNNPRKRNGNQAN